MIELILPYTSIVKISCTINTPANRTGVPGVYEGNTGVDHTGVDVFAILLRGWYRMRLLRQNGGLQAVIIARIVYSQLQILGECMIQA